MEKMTSLNEDGIHYSINESELGKVEDYEDVNTLIYKLVQKLGMYEALWPNPIELSNKIHTMYDGYVEILDDLNRVKCFINHIKGDG